MERTYTKTKDSKSRHYRTELKPERPLVPRIVPTIVHHNTRILRPIVSRNEGPPKSTRQE